MPSTVLSELFTPPLGIEPGSRQTATELRYIPVPLRVLFVFCYLVWGFETRNHFVTRILIVCNYVAANSFLLPQCWVYR